jgi:hypothetical protein
LPTLKNWLTSSYSHKQFIPGHFNHPMGWDIAAKNHYFLIKSADLAPNLASINS